LSNVAEISVRGIAAISAEVTTRELAAGTGFQIAFERDRAAFVSKMDEDVEFPRPAVGCMWTLPSVVGGQSRIHI
jgi:hypothetical protein